MALAIADLEEYRQSNRHRRETVREQNLRLELAAIADSIREFDERTLPHRQRTFLVATECGPLAMASWHAIEYAIERLLRQVSPEGLAA